MRSVLPKVVIILLAAPSLASAVVKYEISADVPANSFLVKIQIDQPGENPQFEIPGWSPGLYDMQHYENTISEVRGSDRDGKGLQISRTGQRSWEVIESGLDKLTLQYRVKAKDVGLGFFGARLGTGNGYVNGASTFMYVVGRKDEASELSVKPPMGWEISTPMHAIGNDLFLEKNYDDLIDCPIDIGTFVRKKFDVRGIPFEAIFVAPEGEKVNLPIDETCDVLAKVSAPAIDLFGSAPFSSYHFVFHLTPAGFQGGLEHHSSTVIAIPNQANQDLSDLTAHEFFHAWNVKQIRPSVLGPFDYTAPQRTGNLWFAEGVTDYYAKVLTYRGGVHDQKWLLEQMSQEVDDYQHGNTRRTKTVEDASRAAWENHGFNLGDLDYYNKGLLAGLILDADIRSATDGAKSLDDVMRLMYARYKKPNAGYPENGILDAIDEVAGKDLGARYNSIIRSTDELPYSDLAKIGLVVEPPSTDFPTGGGWPTPFDGLTEDLRTQEGIADGDVFLGFLPSADRGFVNVKVASPTSESTLRLPVHQDRRPSFTVGADPFPTGSAAKLYEQWTALDKQKS